MTNCNIPKDAQHPLILGYQFSAESGKGAANALLKFFNPAGAQTWYISEGMPLDERGEPLSPEAIFEGVEPADWHLFGFCDLGFPGCAELGYVLLSQLQSVDVGFGLRIERDIHWKPKPLADIQREYREAC